LDGNVFTLGTLTVHHKAFGWSGRHTGRLLLSYVMQALTTHFLKKMHKTQLGAYFLKTNRKWQASFFSGYTEVETYL